MQKIARVLTDFLIARSPSILHQIRPSRISATFWGRSKNKSGSEMGVLPKLGVWADGLEFFRPPEISQATQAAGACGGAWAVWRGPLSVPRYTDVAFGYDDVHEHPGCLRILSVAFGLVSMLDSCPTSSMVPELVWSEDADQVDQGPLNPARLWLGLTLCHLDLRGRVTNGDARGIDGYQELMKTQEKGQPSQLCSAPARCRSRTGFGSNSKVEFGSGPVTTCKTTSSSADHTPVVISHA
ncbi:unnamed protein product [Prunus armeniaca]